MGIRYEKDTILNWINEMGKFLRLLVDKWEGNLEEEAAPLDIVSGYKEFFDRERSDLIGLSHEELELFVATLEAEQIRPLAQLFMYDGLLSGDHNLLEKSKFLFELNMRQSGSFSFEDYGFLAKIDSRLNA